MWTKYHKKDVTNVFGNVVEHWADVDEDGEVEMISASTIDYIDYKSCSNSSGDILKRGGLYTHAPYRDFHHFTGKSKPGLSKGTGHLLQSLENATSAQDSGRLLLGIAARSHQSQFGRRSRHGESSYKPHSASIGLVPCPHPDEVGLGCRE